MQDTKISNASRLMTLFEGYGLAYGTYDSTALNEVKGGKLEIKASAKTVREAITRELWEAHVAGSRSLGIIPVRDDNTCLWGAIDIDVYDISPGELVGIVAKEKLPLVACRSKSGGVHLYLFLAEPVSAELMQARLREMAALIGFGNAEVFPKQRKVEIERGDLGSWLNMPYFGGDAGDRYGFGENGLGLTLSQFLDLAEGHQQPALYLSQNEFRKKPKSDPDWGDGPPCMQHLAAQGFPEGTRNRGLFALATFAKKKYPSRWEEVLERWNRELFDPPLPASEVMSIIKSQLSKEYHYTCRDQPLSSHCNSTLCRTRKFGVGGDDDYPVVSGLSVLNTDPPLWFLDVENDRLELSTDELQNYRAFHKVCMERLFRCYRMMKQESWLTIVSEAMKDAVRIDAPKEVGRTGQFYELLDDFLMNRHRGERIEDVFLGKPFHNAEDRRHYFRLADLERFLSQQNFTKFSRPQMSARIKAAGGDSKFFNIKGKGVYTWWVPDNLQAVPESVLPAPPVEPI